MLTKRIIACLDVQGGRVVKGTRFENLRDSGDPAEMSMRYELEGADEVVFLDISATTEERELSLKAVEETAASLFIPLTVGGGIRSREQARNALNSGADRVAINSAAYENPKLIAELSSQFGSQCVVASIDATRKNGSWEVVTRAGTSATGLDPITWAKTCAEMGAGEILLTSIDRDGTRSGYEIDLLTEVAAAVSTPVIASGGAGKVSDVVDVFKKCSSSAALLAGVLHDKTIDIGEIKTAMRANDIPTREV